MSTFAELQCLNKLLLEDRARLLKEQSRLRLIEGTFEKQTRSLGSLIDELNNGGGNLDNLTRCSMCDIWAPTGTFILVGAEWMCPKCLVDNTSIPHRDFYLSWCGMDVSQMFG
jgi:hypothetical protein